MLHDPSVLDSVDGHGGFVQLGPCSWQRTGQLAFVSTMGGQPGNYLVAFADLILNNMMSRRGLEEYAEGLLQSLPTCWEPGERRVVVQVVFSNQIVHRFDVAGIDRFVEAPNKRFVILRLHVHPFNECVAAGQEPVRAGNATRPQVTMGGQSRTKDPAMTDLAVIRRKDRGRPGT